MNFENTFAGTKVIKLEQNYRSTQTILNAANAVISNNIGRKAKSLWTENGEGEKVNYTLYENGYDEAQGVVDSISSMVRDGWNYNDIAILYRTNAQSRALEEKLMLKNIPYRIYGGVYPQHIPLTAVLVPCVLTIHQNDGIKKAAVHGGIVEVLKDKVTILAEIAEWPDEIDVNRANDAKIRAERRLASKDSNLDVPRAEMALKRSLARLGAAD